MVLVLLRLLLPIIVVTVLLVITYKYASERLEFKDRRLQRKHKERLERDRRDYDALMEFAENDEIEQELRKERQNNTNTKHEHETEN